MLEQQSEIKQFLQKDYILYLCIFTEGSRTYKYIDNTSRKIVN